MASSHVVTYAEQTQAYTIQWDATLWLTSFDRDIGPPPGPVGTRDGQHSSFLASDTRTATGFYGDRLSAACSQGQASTWVIRACTVKREVGDASPD